MTILKTSKIKEYRDSEKVKCNNTCPLFDIEFDTSNVSKACLDHDHSLPKTGEDNSSCGRVRGVLSNVSNLLLGRLEKYWFKYGNHHTHLTFSEFLRNVADYLDKDFSDNPLHPREVEVWGRRLMKYNVATLRNNLEIAGVSQARLKKANKADLVNIYVKEVILPLYGEGG